MRKTRIGVEGAPSDGVGDSDLRSSCRKFHPWSGLAIGKKPLRQSGGGFFLDTFREKSRSASTHFVSYFAHVAHLFTSRFLFFRVPSVKVTPQRTISDFSLPGDGGNRPEGGKTAEPIGIGFRKPANLESPPPLRDYSMLQQPALLPRGRK
jgi:hypothetical protein